MAAPVASRRQSARQIRTSATRPLNYYARAFDGRVIANPGDGALASSSVQPGFFPAITHFTDAADALPQELIKHFSMLKEVDAKVHQPDEELRRLSDAIATLPPPPKPVIPTHDGHFPGLSAQNSIGASRNGSVNSVFTPLHIQPASTQPVASQSTLSDGQTEIERQQLFRQLNYTIKHLAPMLDEKMAVLVTANHVLRKQLDRLESSYRYVGHEISDEARFGSIRHWAYVTEKEAKKPPERSRRENAGTNNYAAAVDDFASIRSEARREAMQAKRARKQQVDSDFDDAPTARKGGKGRKPAAEPADGRSVGLGITNGGPVQGKKRKVPGGATMERSISAAMRGAFTRSPRETPAAEPGKKRTKAAPAAAPKKRSGRPNGREVCWLADVDHRNQPSGVASPRVASSPLVGSFAERDALSRPTTARARHNSTAGSMKAGLEPSKIRPTSSASNQPVNGVHVVVEQVQVVVDKVATVDPSIKSPIKEMADLLPVQAVAELESKEPVPNEDTVMVDAEAPVLTVMTTRAGRASKTATPVTGTFPEIPPSRARSTRNKDPSGGSHASSESGHGDRPMRKKRGNGTSTPSLLAETMGRKSLKADADEERDSTMLDGERSDNPAAPAEGDDDAEEDLEVDENEPRYCYCNGVSYGEMIACDNENCPRGEWFHLKCVGLKEAPPEGGKFLLPYNRHLRVVLTLQENGTARLAGKRWIRGVDDEARWSSYLGTSVDGYRASITGPASSAGPASAAKMSFDMCFVCHRLLA